MKKVLSAIVTTLVAMSFTAVVFAAETKSAVKTEATTVSPAGEVTTAKKEVKKSVKKKKSGKKVVTKDVKEETTTTPAPAAK